GSVINVMTAIGDGCAEAISPRRAIGQDAVGHGQHTRLAEDGAAPVGGTVAGESAVGDGQDIQVVDGTPFAEKGGAAVGTIAGEGAVGHAQRGAVQDGAG